MNFTLVFCKDGVLRVTCGNSKMPLPLKFLQNEHQTNKDNDLAFLARWWEDDVIFEEGTTVGSFLRCLEPWQKFWQDFIGKDIPAYIAESRRPVLVKSDTDPDVDNRPLDWVKLYYVTEFSADIHFEERKKGETFGQWMNANKKVQFNGYWDVDGHYTLSGYHKGEVEQYGVDHCSMSELANVPFVLGSDHIVHVTDYYCKKYLGKNKSLFNHKAFGLRKLDERKRHQFDYILSKKRHNLKSVVDAFFWWFAATPVSRDAFTESLRDSVKELDDALAEEKKVLENSKHTDEKSSEKEVVQEDDTGVKGQLKVRVAPGAFDGLTAQMEKEKDYWTEHVDKYKASTGKGVVRIGSIKKATDLENRVFSSIVEKADLSTGFLDPLIPEKRNKIVFMERNGMEDAADEE